MASRKNASIDHYRVSKSQLFKTFSNNMSRQRQDKGKHPIVYSSSLPLEHVVESKLLDFHERLIFFETA